MAYNRKNYYKRIIAIQEIVLEKQVLGIPNTRIYKDYIEVRFLIAESTFKKYLGIPAKRELKKLEELERLKKLEETENPSPSDNSKNINNSASTELEEIKQDNTHIILPEMDEKSK